MRIGAFALLASLFLPLPLAADSITFQLTSDQFGATQPPVDSAEVTVDQTSTTTAVVTFDAEIVGGVQYYMSDAFLNVAGDYTLGTVTVNGGGGYSTLTGASLDSEGRSSLEVVSGSGPAADASTQIIVDILAAGGNTWADAAAVLTATCPSNGSQHLTCSGGYGVTNPNGAGGYAADHYTQGYTAGVQVGTNGTYNGGNDATDDHDLSNAMDLTSQGAGATPEPSSLILLGTGLAMAAGIARRRLQPGVDAGPRAD